MKQATLTNIRLVWDVRLSTFSLAADGVLPDKKKCNPSLASGTAPALLQLAALLMDWGKQETASPGSPLSARVSDDGLRFL